MSARLNLLKQIKYEMETNDSKELKILYKNVQDHKGIKGLSFFEKRLRVLINDNV